MPNGSFLYSVEFDGSWYDVFARYGNDLADGYIGYDVIDEFGNRLNGGPPLKRLPREAQVGGLVRWWRADRTVWIRASPRGWLFVAAGKKVRLALSEDWWPR